MNEKKYKNWLCFWYSLAVFFNAVMDTIEFHSYSWLVRIWPDFMRIKTEGEWWQLQKIDGWHCSKLLALGCLTMCLFYALKLGKSFFVYQEIDFKYFIKFILVQAILTMVIFGLCFHVIFIL